MTPLRWGSVDQHVLPVRAFGDWGRVGDLVVADHPNLGRRPESGLVTERANGLRALVVDDVVRVARELGQERADLGECRLRLDLELVHRKDTQRGSLVELHRAAVAVKDDLGLQEGNVLARLLVRRHVLEEFGQTLRLAVGCQPRVLDIADVVHPSLGIADDAAVPALELHDEKAGTRQEQDVDLA